eukprot:tig00000042_g15471.t1
MARGGKRKAVPAASEEVKPDRSLGAAPKKRSPRSDAEGEVSSPAKDNSPAAKLGELAEEILIKIMRALALEVRACALVERARRALHVIAAISEFAAAAAGAAGHEPGQWTAALREANELRRVNKRFKSAIDAAGGPLALFESVTWDEGAERWLDPDCSSDPSFEPASEAAVDAFFSDRAPRLAGLREVTVDGGCENCGRFVSALPCSCWPSLLSLRLLALPGSDANALGASLDALTAAPTLQLCFLEIVSAYKWRGAVDRLTESILRRCALSLRTLRLHNVGLYGLRELRLEHDEGTPAAVCLGGLERSLAGAALEELALLGVYLFEEDFPLEEDTACALAALPAVARLTIDTTCDPRGAPRIGYPPYGRYIPRPHSDDSSEDATLWPPAPPAGSFPVLRSLILRGPFTHSRWWATALASPASAALHELSLSDVRGAGRILEAVGSSGAPLALRSLSIELCLGEEGGPDALAALLAACPALERLSIVRCPVPLVPVLRALAIEPAAPALRELTWSHDDLVKAKEKVAGSRRELYGLLGGRLPEAARLLRALAARGVACALDFPSAHPVPELVAACATGRRPRV